MLFAVYFVKIFIPLLKMPSHLNIKQNPRSITAGSLYILKNQSEYASSSSSSFVLNPDIFDAIADAKFSFLFRTILFRIHRLCN